MLGKMLRFLPARQCAAPIRARSASDGLADPALALGARINIAYSRTML